MSAFKVENERVEFRTSTIARASLPSVSITPFNISELLSEMESSLSLRQADCLVGFLCLSPGSYLLNVGRGWL